MTTRGKTFFILAGAAVLFLALAPGSPAQENSHSGDFAFMTTASEEMPLSDGHVLMRVVQSGMIFADDPASPMDRTATTCSGSTVMEASARATVISGHCDGVDADGDVWTIWYAGDQDGGDWGYMGKRGYPSAPEVFDVPLLVRHPDGVGAGKRSDMFVQHTDLAAQILEFAGQPVSEELHGKCFFDRAVNGGEAIRDNVTVAWGSNVTVIDERWWLNCKVNGSGVLLRDLAAEKPFEGNVGDENPEVVKRLFQVAIDEAGGSIPDFLMELANSQRDAPGCSDLAARE